MKNFSMAQHRNEANNLDALELDAKKYSVLDILPIVEVHI